MIVPKKTYKAEEIQVWMVSQLAKSLGMKTDEIDVLMPLENFGLDSAKAMLFVTKAQDMLGFEVSPTLLWYYPNIEILSQRLAEESEELNSQVNNNSFPPVKNVNLDLSAEAVLDPSIHSVSSYQFTSEHENIFLTGGTGFLGAFLIKELLQQTKADIYCLVHASNLEAGKNKLKSNLLAYSVWDERFSSRIIPILGDLSQPLLGISPEGFETLAASISAIYHSGALLNYVYPYSVLKAVNVLGTQEILRLASHIKVKPVHYISSVAVFESTAYARKVVKENDDFSHWEGIYLGYSQTKWVAEKLVKIAGEQGLPITIHRPPLISGDSNTGICNTDDFINLMAKGCILMGSFPDVDYMLDMSPVDYVSKAIVYLSLQKESLGHAFHLQHPEPVSLKILVNWLRSFGFPIAMIPYEEWQAQLNNITSVDNPLYTLRLFLLERWSAEQITIPDLYLKARRPIISCEATLNALAASSIVCPSIDTRLFTTYCSYLIENGFLKVA